MNKKIEILSPVGSFASLNAAIQGGANSIYFGLDKLNMRSRSANNFTTSDLNEIKKIANENSLKLYLTVNTIIYDNEISDMKYIIDMAKDFELDAVIATDFATINYVKKINIPIHLSTQCNVSNTEAVKFYAQYGEVIVLARELSLEQIKYISNIIETEKILSPSGNLVRLEAFVHGALCMAISSKCYLSLHETQHSANRGECMQLCRRSYTVTDTETNRSFDIKNKYIMSPQDLCTINILDKILASGISLLKIEGRGRSPDYVKTVTKCYREAVDAINENTYTQEKIENWLEQLKSVYNRGLWEGSYLGTEVGKWSNTYGSKATKKKVYLGKVRNYYKKIQVGEFLLQNDLLNPGDEFMIIGNNSGVVNGVVSELRIDFTERKFAQKGDIFTMPISEVIRENDKLYKVVDVNT